MASAADPAPSTIRDIVTVRAHPTVVRLDDLEGASPAWIHESFLLTPEIEGHLRALVHAFAAPHGTGVFLIGPNTPFGSRIAAPQLTPPSFDVRFMPHHSRGLGPTL